MIDISPVFSRNHCFGMNQLDIVFAEKNDVFALNSVRLQMDQFLKHKAF
jgi:hypothetical protein